MGTRISSKVRPHEPGGRGAARITTPREGVAVGTGDPSVLIDVGPQMVPARVSVVLVEETGVRCAGQLASVPVDLDEHMLAEVACPAGVAECVDDFILPMLAGTVSPSDVTEQVADDTASLADAGILLPAVSARILFPAVPARIPFLAGHVGLDGTLSSSDPVGILFPAVPAGMLFPAGPVVPVGTLSLPDSAEILFLAGTVGPVGPVWTLSSSDSAGVLSSAIPAGILFLAGPVGPVCFVGTLSPSDLARILLQAVPAGKLFPVAPGRNGTLSPTDPAGLLFPAVPAGMPFPVDSDSDGTLSPTVHAGVLFPVVLTEFPVLDDPVVVRLHADPTVIDTRSVVDMAVVEEVRLAVPDVVHDRAVVAMVGIDAVYTGEESPMDCDADDDTWDPRNDFETVDGMPVYYGGNFDDSNCEDPRDLAYIMRIGCFGITLMLRRDVVLTSRGMQ